MICGPCGTGNPVGAKFCQECGSPLATGCASCGATLAPGAKFCSECGARAGSTAPAAVPGAGPAGTVPAAASAERRLVSVLFADLVGFTPFSEERDSEDVRETLTRYFAIASQVIEAHGGTVEKFIGDAVMAVWGTPVAREDDAERAVRAALELLDAIKALGLGITARAGVLTGEAAVTLGATNQGMVAGDIVNTAARLQSVAAPGTVLVGETTYRAASAAIAFEEAGLQQLKGKDEPVATWRALRVIAERGGRNRADGLEPPFTGRDDELRMLKDAFHATAREGRTRLVSITGPAGIGKSRLALEFGKYLDGVVGDVWWHHGRSPAYGQGITFWALGEMVRGRAGITEGANEEATRAAVDGMLAEHVPDPAERAWVRPAILALLGLEGEKVAADELFARWRLLFERLSATGTVALVFEDLHWADPATLDFIDHLLDWSKSFPILVVTLSRPELLDRRPDWGIGRRSFTGIALEPLSDAAMRELLLGVAPGLPADAVGRIVARAEGMPLYAVETLRMLVADRRLVLQEGVYVAVGDVSDIAVPETLTALIAARLDALDPADRALVLDAAVLGQSFTPDGLAAVSGQPREAVEPRLRTLLRRELFTLEADPRSPERGQYAFVQALIREVAYNTLARRDRKDRHLAAARYFESIGSDELAGALAGHYVAAYENASPGPEADALAAQARVALRGAADRAFSLASFEQAVDLLQSALKVTQDPVERAAALERMGTAASMSGRHGEAVAWLADALEIARGSDDRPGVLRISRELGRALIEAGMPARAGEVLEQALVDCTPEDRLALTAIRSQLARALMLQGLFAQSLVVADEVLDVADREELWDILADTLVTRGGALSNAGRLHEGRAVTEAGLQLAERYGLLNTRFRALYNISSSISRLDVPAALALGRQGLELARQMGVRYWESAFVGGFLNILITAGALGEAEREYLRAGDDMEGQDLAGLLSSAAEVVAVRGGDPAPIVARLRDLVARDDAAELHYVLTETMASHAWLLGDYGGAMAAGRAYAHQRIGYEFMGHFFQLRAAAWLSDEETMAEQLAAIAALPRQTPPYRQAVEVLRAALTARQGHSASAIQDAITAIHDLDARGARYEACYSRIDLGRVAGLEDGRVVAEVRAARAAADEMGALVLRDLADGLLAAVPARGDGHVTTPPSTDDRSRIET